MKLLSLLKRASNKPGRKSDGSGQMNYVQRFVSHLGFKTGIAIFVALVIVVFTAAMSNVRYEMALRSRVRYPLFPGDQLVISESVNMEDLSSFLCSEYGVIIEGGKAHVYLVDPASVTADIQHETRVIRVNGSTVDPYLSFYLLKGSRLQASGCSDQQEEMTGSATVLYFQDMDTFTTWNCSHHDDNKTLATSTFDLDQQSDCNLTRLDVPVKTPDTSFLVVTAREFTGRVSVDLQRKFYRIGPYMEACHWKTACVFPLPYNTPVEIVISIDSVEHQGTPAYLTTRCLGRAVFWVCVLVIPPLIIIFISVVVCCVCGRGDGLDRSDSRRSQGQPLRAADELGYDGGGLAGRKVLRLTV